MYQRRIDGAPDLPADYTNVSHYQDEVAALSEFNKLYRLTLFRAGVKSVLLADVWPGTSFALGNTRVQLFRARERDNHCGQPSNVCKLLQDVAEE